MSVNDNVSNNRSQDADVFDSAQTKPIQNRYSLTPRGMDVLKLLVEGLTNKAIAGSLCISEVTAEKHVQSIISKLESDDRTEAEVKAIRTELLDA
jgi:DNA-binding NarL/FixJ family response regulator